MRKPDSRPSRPRVCMDGNEAAAHVAFRLNEVCAIYPITPSSPMGEFADQWSCESQPNLWGEIPSVVEMQSEGGAAGALHGALQTGALATTFTASQGLLLMIPNMYKIAGELSPCVIHVAARSIAAQALSIFGDHSDVMAARQTGFAMLCSSNVQEAHDFALVAQAASLNSRIPFMHFFDGFRTSHEVNTLELLADEDLRALIDDEAVLAHRNRGLTPDAPVIRGTAQNPDVYFQGRETVNARYDELPDQVRKVFVALAAQIGRYYDIVEYTGAEDAERVIVIMGSGADTVKQTVASLTAQGERVGVVHVRLYRPWPTEAFLSALPSAVKSIAVLDRTKEPGSFGEPMFLDVTSSIQRAVSTGTWAGDMPCVVGGRYGLSSKEFTPAMVLGVYQHLLGESPKHGFTVGIDDDVTHTSIPFDPTFSLEPENCTRAMFFGLGADGTVGANKNSIKILGDIEGTYAQGYFVYDSKKSGSRTLSHLRFGPSPIQAPYLIQSANFIGCHQFNFVGKVDMLERAEKNAVFLVNSPHGPDTVWDHLPRHVQEEIVDKEIRLFVVDAYKVARETGMGSRINTIMQTCFFAISDFMPREQAIAEIEQAIRKTYARKGPEVVRANIAAVEATLAHLHEVTLEDVEAKGHHAMPEAVPADAPRFLQQVTAKMLMDKGDQLPVSAIPEDGTSPTGTTKYEKRNVSQHVPIWEPDLCIQCGNCSFVCPHSVIRAKFYDQSELADAPAGFPHAKLRGRGNPGAQYTLQFYVEDCTGCGLCVDVCPAKSREASRIKAINMGEKAKVLDQEREHIAFFETIKDDPTAIDWSKVRGVQYLDPLFEFPGACAGCGETPYLRLLTQLFGDRMLVAKATGCSSIYGGNLPTTPWTKNDDGRGPAWANSLFEDNAEFGLGYRLTTDLHEGMAMRLLVEHGDSSGQGALIQEILNAAQEDEQELVAQRQRVDTLIAHLESLEETPNIRQLKSVVGQLVRRSVWIVGGDGWAYDIGYGGLDHVLASGRNVNILVLDTEVYSNTGGQASKSTPKGAIAKFAAAGKVSSKKDLALMAIAYGNVYVGRIAMGANRQHTLKTIREAEAYQGPSLILAYSHCIAHGINMTEGMQQQHRAAHSGHWPLLRYNPLLKDQGENPVMLDTPEPTIPLREYTENEVRYSLLRRLNPERADELHRQAQNDIKRRYAFYRELAGIDAPPLDDDQEKRS